MLCLLNMSRVYFKKAATPQVMAIQGGRIQNANKKSLKAKGEGKGNGKGKDKSYIPKPKTLNLLLKEHPAKDNTCHNCKGVGHYKRNCPAYLAELIKKKKQVGTASSSDIFVIELFSFLTKSWVYDTGCGTHIYNTKHGLRGVRKLKQVEAIGSDDFVLPNGLMICLDNCNYAPTVTRGVVSVSSLVINGLIQCFTDYRFSVSKNNALYLMLLRVMVLMKLVFKNEVENQLGKTIKALRSDRGDEYISQEFKDYLKVCAIVQQLTPSDTVCCMHFNMVPTKMVYKTPYELWYENVPNLTYLKVWGCEALVMRDTPDKLQQRSFKCIFVGYPKEIIGYYFYFPPENKMLRDTSASENTSEIPMEVKGFEPPQEELILIRSLGDLNEPANYKAAMLDLEYDKWLDARNAKMKFMKDNQVWRLVDLPPNWEAAFILGIKIYRDRSKRLIRLSQCSYIDKILRRFKMDTSKHGYIPKQERLDLNKTQGASTLGKVKREAHSTVVKTILKYVRNTKDMFLVYGKNPEGELRVDCYCNAGFGTDRDEIKSQTRYVFILNGRRSRLEKLQSMYYCNVCYKS
ncbi:retrotransposon protein, putative, ty1-copia subclass [Tanacetum coccineum]